MKQSELLNSLVAIAIAAAFILTSPMLLADETKAQYRSDPSYHMRQGMMGGNGMGPGMMGSYGMGGIGGMGSYGMGQGMMGGRMWLLDELDLTDAQQSKINKIQDEARKSHWTMMGEMMDLQAEQRDLYAAPKRDSAAIDNSYKKLGLLLKKMYESNMEVQKRIEANLTQEQQEKLRKYSRRGW